MCKTSTPTRSGTSSRLPTIAPNAGTGTGGGGTGGGSGGSGTGGGAPATLPDKIGEPEHLTAPGLTFIRRPTGTDLFLDGAISYHTFFGLAPRQVDTLAEVVELLSQVTGNIQRARIVTHAHPLNMIIPLFTGWDEHAMEADLNAFSQDEVHALEGGSFGIHFPAPDALDRLMVHLAANHAAVIAPFRIDSALAMPTGRLASFMSFALDTIFVNHLDGAGNSRWIRSGGHLTAAQQITTNDYLTLTLNRMQAALANTQINGATITNAQLTTLRNTITGLQPANLNYVPPGASGRTNIGANFFARLTRYSAAVQSNFFANRRTMLTKLTASTVIDIRGCRAGSNATYLAAVRAYFGGSVTVTAPNWFQSFPDMNYEEPADNAAINTLLTTQTWANPAADMRGAFQRWMVLTRINTEHEPIWRDILAAGDGKTFAFCKLDWRARFPASPIPFPGLVAFQGLNATTAFRQVMEAIQRFFNAAASTLPGTDALWNPIATYIATHLTNHYTALFAELNATTTDARRLVVFNLLSTVDTQLGQSIVPATPPSGLDNSTLQGYQTQLIQFVEANQLAPIRAFMTAVLARINSTATPGFYFYMLHIGMPVFIMGVQENTDRAAHTVTRSRHGLIVVQQHAAAAFLTWCRLQWEETIPPGSSMTAASGATATRRTNAWCSILVERETTGLSVVATCPHPDFFAQINHAP